MISSTTLLRVLSITIMAFSQLILAETTTIKDDSGHQYDAKVWGDAQFVPGKHGSAIQLNHVGNYVEVRETESFNPRSYTISGWFKLDSLPGLTTTGQWGETYYLVAKPGQYYLEISPTKFIFTLSGSEQLEAKFRPVVGQWIHWACTFDGKKMRSYINGVLEGVKVVSKSPALTKNPIQIGSVWTREGQKKGFFKGAIDDVKIWNKAFTPAEVRKVLKIEKDFSVKNMFGSWSFDNYITEKARGWKWDVTIYDRSGWTAAWLGGVALLENDEIIITGSANKEGTYFDDFYGDVSEGFAVSSTDGGKSWNETSPSRYPEPKSGILADGSMIEADYVYALPAELEARRRIELDKVDLGHLADNPGWLIFPESMSAEIKAKGYDVFDYHPTIPKGQVAAFVCKVRLRRSTDEGNNWKECPIKDSFVLGHGPVFWGTEFTKLPDGTILKQFYGSELFEKVTQVYVLRSSDQGKTWETIQVASIPGTKLNETEMVSFPDGRVVAMIRSDDPEGEAYYIYSAISDDAGRTWKPPVRTPILGQPLRALLLKSGNILLTYAYRTVPAGARACISYDRGETWDIENEIRLRDDIIATYWISPSGPMSVQLSDGTIFTAYSVVKIVEIKPGDMITNNDFSVHRKHYHSYLVGNRYTETFVGPVP